MNLHNQKHDHGREIDRLLAVLNQAQSTPGMETRILHHLEQHRRTRVSPPWTRRIAWAGGLAAAAITIIFAIHHSDLHLAPNSVAAHADTSATVFSTPPATRTQQPAPDVKEQPPAERAQAERPPIQTAHAAQTVQTAQAIPNDATAESFPAPPMPLTQQEKLLLRIAHRGEQASAVPPPTIALGTEIAELRADTDKFFQDPATGENQWKQIVAEQAAPQ